MAISKEQIFAVADELDAAGQNPEHSSTASSPARPAALV